VRREPVAKARDVGHGARSGADSPAEKYRSPPGPDEAAAERKGEAKPRAQFASGNRSISRFAAGATSRASRSLDQQAEAVVRRDSAQSCGGFHEIREPAAAARHRAVDQIRPPATPVHRASEAAGTTHLWTGRERIAVAGSIRLRSHAAAVAALRRRVAISRFAACRRGHLVIQGSDQVGADARAAMKSAETFVSAPTPWSRIRSRNTMKIRPDRSARAGTSAG